MAIEAGRGPARQHRLDVRAVDRRERDHLAGRADQAEAVEPSPAIDRKPTLYLGRRGGDETAGRQVEVDDRKDAGLIGGHGAHGTAFQITVEYPRDRSDTPRRDKSMVMATVLDAREVPLSLLSRRQFELVRLSAVRQLKSRYRGTSLGILWSFANPLLTTALYTAIFGTAFKAYYGGSTSRYVFSAFVGVTVIAFFLQATTEALGSVVANGGLLNKIALDAETFPYAAIAANAFQQSVTSFPVLLILAAVLTHDPIRVALVPVVLAGIVALSAGFALALAALFVFFRDLAYLWSIFGFVFWITSPVFYPAALVPVAVRPYLAVNPVALGIGSLRDVTLGRGPIDFGLIVSFLLVAAGCAAVGHALFRALRRDFMDLL